MDWRRQTLGGAARHCRWEVRGLDEVTDSGCGVGQDGSCFSTQSLIPSSQRGRLAAPPRGCARGADPFL